MIQVRMFKVELTQGDPLYLPEHKISAIISSKEQIVKVNDVRMKVSLILNKAYIVRCDYDEGQSEKATKVLEQALRSVEVLSKAQTCDAHQSEYVETLKDLINYYKTPDVVVITRDY